MTRWLRLAVLSALVLAACGGPKTTTTTGGSAGTTPSAGTGTAGGEHDMSSMGGAACTPSGTSLTIVAQMKGADFLFDKDCLAAPAGQAFTITIDNKDQDIPHNIAILKSHTSPDVLFRGELFQGPKSQTSNVPALPAGTYAFHCEVHPTTMMGTFVVK